MNNSRLVARTGRRGWSLLLVVPLTAALLSSTPAPAQEQPWQVGRWVPRPPNDPQDPDPDYCWPYGAMHMIHLPTGAILMWYSPGCGYHPYEMHPECPAGLASEETPRLWDPVTGAVTPVEMPNGIALMDCQGHSGLARAGLVAVLGGGCDPAAPSKQAYLFHPNRPPGGSLHPWQAIAPMQENRWYPSSLTLASGKLGLFGGVNACPPCDPPSPGCCVYQIATAPEVYDPQTNAWTLHNGASHPDMEIYPFMFQLPPMPAGSSLPDGGVFFAGPGMRTSVLDPATWTWTHHFDHDIGTEQQRYALKGSAVTYEPGKILKCGGYNPANGVFECQSFQTSISIDFTTANPSWQQTSSQMNFGRKDHNLVLLPDGSILAVAGQGQCVYNEPENHDCFEQCGCCTPQMKAERFDPVLQTWNEMAEATRPRGYHNTAVLTKAGTVLSAGGENWNMCTPSADPPAYPCTNPLAYPWECTWDCGEWHSSRSAEVFEPPYLFSEQGPAARPVICCAPAEAAYGANFQVRIAPDPNLGTLQARASLIRLPAVSHGFDENQRFMWLSAHAISGSAETGYSFSVAAPANSRLAPPGHYMLFVLSTTGVPSEGHYIRIDSACAADLDHDGQIDGQDMAILLGQWTGSAAYSPCAPFNDADLNLDCKVNGQDVAILLGGWGPCPASECACSGSSSSSQGGGAESSLAATPESLPGGGPPVDLLLMQFWHWHASSDWAAFFDWHQSQQPPQ